MLLILFSSLNALAEARWAPLVLAPVLGRWGMTAAIVAFPYARPAGLGRDIKDHAGTTQIVVASLTALAVAAVLAWKLGNYAPFAAILASALAWWLGARCVLDRIPGMTGDTYGAIAMLIEMVVLLTFVGMR